MALCEFRWNPQMTDLRRWEKGTDLIEDTANDDLAERLSHAATITEEGFLMNRAFSAGFCTFVNLGCCPRLI